MLPAEPRSYKDYPRHSNRAGTFPHPYKIPSVLRGTELRAASRL